MIGELECFSLAVKLLITGAFTFGAVSCVSPGIYCYGSGSAKMGSDIYWYSTKVLLNLLNCVTLLLVYVRVLLQFRAKERNRRKLELKAFQSSQHQRLLPLRHHPALPLPPLSTSSSTKLIAQNLDVYFPPVMLNFLSRFTMFLQRQLMTNMNMFANAGEGGAILSSPSLPIKAKRIQSGN